MKFLAIFLLIAAASTQDINPAQFLAQVFRHHGTGDQAAQDILALGVIINQRHVITVASALDQIDRAQIRVHLQSATFRVSPDVRVVEEIFVHENFAMATPLVNNIAILRIPYSLLDTVTTVPRNLGTLSVRECRAFIFPSWGEAVSTRTVQVTAANCAVGAPFCSTIPLEDTVSTCVGGIGSPVICADNNYVDGITTAEMDCGNLDRPMQARMTFLSIHTHADWISRISGASINAKISIILVLLGVVIGKILM